MIRRITKAVAAIGFGHGISIISNVLLVPLFLRFWTSDLYGEWLVLSSVVAYLSTLDMGMQTYLVNRLTQKHQADDVAGYRDLQHSGLALYLAIATVGTVIVFSLSCAVPLKSWLRLEHTGTWTARIVVTLLGAQLLWALPVNFVSAIYQTMGNLARSEWRYQLHRAGVAASTAIALVLRPTPLTLACVQLIPLIASAFFVILDATRRFPQLRFGLRNARSGLVFSIVRPSLLFAGILLAQAVTVQGSILVISSVLGASAVALFVITRTLANLSRQVVGLLSTATWTEVTILEAKGDQSALRFVHHLLLALAGAGSSAVAAALWFEGPSVIAAWTSGKIAPNPMLLRLLLAQTILGTPWIAASMIPAASNRHRRLSAMYLASSVIGVTLAAVGVRLIGIDAVPIGLFVGELIACYHFVPRDACGMMGQEYREYMVRVWSSFLATAVLAGFVAWLVHELAAARSAPLRWALSGASTTVVALVFGWALWLSPRERNAVRGRVFAILQGQPSV